MARRFRKLGKFCGIGWVGDWVVVGFSGGLGDWLGFYVFCGEVKSELRMRMREFLIGVEEDLGGL